MRRWWPTTCPGDNTTVDKHCEKPGCFWAVCPTCRAVLTIWRGEIRAVPDRRAH